MVSNPPRTPRTGNPPADLPALVLRLLMRHREGCSDDRRHDLSLLRPFPIERLRLRNRIISSAHEPTCTEDAEPKSRRRLHHAGKATGGLRLRLPAAVLVPSSTEGKEIAARLAVRIGSGIITDAIDLEAGGVGPVAVQPVFAASFTTKTSVYKGTPATTVKSNSAAVEAAPASQHVRRPRGLRRPWCERCGQLRDHRGPRRLPRRGRRRRLAPAFQPGRPDWQGKDAEASLFGLVDVVPQLSEEINTRKSWRRIGAQAPLKRGIIQRSFEIHKI
jgi:hypothetical protein